MSWGTYEMLFDSQLSALLTVSGQMEKNPKWHVHNYGKRKDLFKKGCAACYGGHPKIGRYFRAILDDSTAIQKDRNLIVHGKYALRTEIRERPLPPQLWLVAENKHGAKKFTLEDLEQLGYDIMHLAGRLSLCAPQWASDPNMNPPGLSSEDISVIREVLSKTPPSHSILPTQPDRL